jgi:hypothetical protein
MYKRTRPLKTHPIFSEYQREENPLAPKQKIKSPESRNAEVNHIQDNSHTFIARFWLEKREIKNAKPIWRGVVEHVASGQRRYLQDLNEIKTFISSQLNENGIWPRDNSTDRKLK